MPYGFHLDPSEHVIRVVHRHWIDLFPVIVASTIVIMLVPVFGGYYLAKGNKDVLPMEFVSMALLAVLFLAIMILILGFYVYRQNYLVLTNMHLIQVEQRGLFVRQVAQLSLARLQDVSGKRVGVIATVLNFGNMEVQSAGEHEKFIFRNAPSPEKLADECLMAHENYLKEFGASNN